MRKSILIVSFCFLFCCSSILAQSPKEKIGTHLQKCSVTILKNRNDRGSGTIITRMVEGKKVNWILTANHVINDLRSVTNIIDDEGSDKKEVRYKDAEILQEWIDETTGERVGETKMFAKVINVDKEKDIALLRVRRSGWVDESIEFYLGETITGPGAEAVHCGSPGGQDIGAGSVLWGNIARVGCRIEEFSSEPFDQVNCSGLPGSSGGMVVNIDGLYIGMVTLGLGSGDSFHWMVPVRSIRKWVNQTGVQWLLDPKGTTTEEAIKKIKLENVRPGFVNMSKSNESETLPTSLKIQRINLTK